MSKKVIAVILSVGILTSVFTGCAQKQQEPTSGNKNVTSSVNKEVYSRAESVDSGDAKKLLIEGNKRFVSGNVLGEDISKENLKKLSGGQKPFAVIVSCSDSRVDPETIFDQGLGDLFVIRDAGNVVDKITLGSIEYGAEHLNAPLILVLGHESCGAVKAAVDKAQVSENIQEIVDKINISVKNVEAKNPSKDKIYQEVEDANIKNTVSEIEKDPIIEELIKENKVKVVGAKYHIETGEVNFE
ncbi:carbonic anhydrase [Clostridium beijerinckii]|uniref:carbonic anhydrase n=1 Tax=Clostridium beijerinckii TaxID=1520 RepID=A0A9Q5CLS9_CLOBE|nr:carbonic anhydrase [Clostridium beijerinckii]AQS05448.1 carbonic anhydrase 2 [Clostridium beijerinckii]MBA2885052.1 carbonic anhydrase [Clostridium beijerinckii]MBA2899575.1 carbonic anhydrase [Clostridium beijerinckii]MBA2909403.1 carbonic anhydrase [Clostridium beijerinckii]MBA9014976.1 carbonic anhydrase [Clostridium beijerinckii]